MCLSDPKARATAAQKFARNRVDCDKLANTLTDEEYLSITTLHGCPSSSFYINNDAPSHSSEDETTATDSSSVEEEEGKSCKD